jgi:hypothetical protein
MLSKYFGRLVSLVLRSLDPRRSYSLTWECRNDGAEEIMVGSFGECNAMMRHLMAGKEPALNIRGFRPDGEEDTFLFPAACVDNGGGWY